MIELSKDDINIIISHSKEFLEPILTITQLSNLHLSEAELIQNEDFNRVLAQLTEIDRQGLRPQFYMLVTIIMQ